MSTTRAAQTLSMKLLAQSPSGLSSLLMYAGHGEPHVHAFAKCSQHKAILLLSADGEYFIHGRTDLYASARRCSPRPTVCELQRGASPVVGGGLVFSVSTQVQRDQPTILLYTTLASASRPRSSWLHSRTSLCRYSSWAKRQEHSADLCVNNAT